MTTAGIGCVIVDVAPVGFEAPAFRNPPQPPRATWVARDHLSQRDSAEYAAAMVPQREPASP